MHVQSHLSQGVLTLSMMGDVPPKHPLVEKDWKLGNTAVVYGQYDGCHCYIFS